MSVTKPIFRKLTFARLLIKNFYTESHENPRNSLVAVARSKTDVVSMLGVRFLLRKESLPCKIDGIHADPKGNWYRLARRKIDHQPVHGSVC
jgi:hypothetical protein